MDDIDEARAQAYAEIWKHADRAPTVDKTAIYLRWKQDNQHTLCYLPAGEHTCTNACTLVCPFEESGDTDLFVCLQSHRLHRCNLQECEYSRQNSDTTWTCRVRGVTWFSVYQMAGTSAKFDAHEMHTFISGNKSRNSTAFQQAMCGLPPQRRTAHAQRATAKQKQQKSKRRKKPTPNTCSPDDIHKVEQMTRLMFWSAKRRDAQRAAKDKHHAHIERDKNAQFTHAKKTKAPICSIRRHEVYFSREATAQTKQCNIPCDNAFHTVLHDWLSRTVSLAFNRYRDYVDTLKLHKGTMNIATKMKTAIRACVSLDEFVFRFVEAMRDGAFYDVADGRQDILIDRVQWVDACIPRDDELVRIFPGYRNIRMKRAQISIILNLARRLHRTHPFATGPPSLSAESLFGLSQ